MFIQGPNPCHYQTKKNTFIIEEKYNIITTIITPIGKLSICNGMITSCGIENLNYLKRQINSRIIKDLGLELIERGDYSVGSQIVNNKRVPQKRTQYGYFGPWYQVTGIRGCNVKRITEKGTEESSGAHFDYFKNHNDSDFYSYQLISKYWNEIIKNSFQYLELI